MSEKPNWREPEPILQDAISRISIELSHSQKDFIVKTKLITELEHLIYVFNDLRKENEELKELLGWLRDNCLYGTDSDIGKIPGSKWNEINNKIR
jgi:hypothetical protein